MSIAIWGSQNHARLERILRILAGASPAGAILTP